MKHFVCPDLQWYKKVTIFGALNSVIFVLGPYWLFFYFLVSGEKTERPAWVLGLAIFLNVIGQCVM